MHMNKYRNKPCVIDGHRFSSQGEGLRFRELKILDKAGNIRNLVLQPRYEIRINNMKICTYVGDFSYEQGISGGLSWESILEDYKCVLTPIYKLKKKLVKAVHDIEITEIT